MSKTMRCAQCGKGTVRPVARSGRLHRHKTMMLEVPAEIVIPTCDNCGEEWIGERLAHTLTTKLEKIYRAELTRRARAAIDAISVHASQRKLEQLLGLSIGYLSKIRSGERVPAPDLVSHLALLARDPKRRLRELERYWLDREEAA
jgi:transcriptional regulator with XRE-family HTH domain